MTYVTLELEPPIPWKKAAKIDSFLLGVTYVAYSNSQDVHELKCKKASVIAVKKLLNKKKITYRKAN